MRGKESAPPPPPAPRSGHGLYHCLSFTLGVRDFNLDPRKQYEGQIKQKSFHVRVGEHVQFPCPELAKAIQRDGGFKYVTWSYCYSEICNDEHTKWAWMAGLNSTGFIKVKDTGTKLNN